MQNKFIFMGITGLLPLLKDALTPVNIKDFQGSTVGKTNHFTKLSWFHQTIYIVKIIAVDTYCWIYRGAFSCAEALALGKPADGLVCFFSKNFILIQKQF